MNGKINEITIVAYRHGEDQVIAKVSCADGKASIEPLIDDEKLSFYLNSLREVQARGMGPVLTPDDGNAYMRALMTRGSSYITMHDTSPPLAPEVTL